MSAFRQGRARLSRRLLMRGVLAAPLIAKGASANSGRRFVLNPTDRSGMALRIRAMRAEMNSRKAIPSLPVNDDETRYANKAGSFTKGLPHAQNGDVDLTSYEALLSALNSNRAADFEKIPRGSGRRLVNPQAGNGFCLNGEDPQSFSCPAPPQLASAEMAAEMVELYWQALCRDVPFSAYATSPLIARACSDLSRLPAFKGPRAEGQVTPSTIFRGNLGGSLSGPFISQFLLKPTPVNSGLNIQRYNVPKPGTDFATTYSEYQLLLTGVPPWRTYVFEDQRRYLITGRDLAECVHFDCFILPFQFAAVNLAQYGPEFILNSINQNLSESDPYKHVKNQVGFVTFGIVTINDCLGRAMAAALKAAWAAKWYVHRRLRPEQAGGRLHNTLLLGAQPVLHESLATSVGVQETFRKYGTYLLPQAYPEGAPLHPAYPSGHAVVAGACATVLKTFYDVDAIVADCVVPTEDGSDLVPSEHILTVGDEIDKLAWNVSIGRDFAGIHYRSDLDAGLRLGEEVALSVLRDVVYELPEDFPELRVRLFDRTYASITKQSL